MSGGLRKGDDDFLSYIKYVYQLYRARFAIGFEAKVS